jgi:hypothetical protein
LPSCAPPELNPVESVWQYLRSNWLSNRVFDTYDAIIDAACEAWMKLIAMPKTITQSACENGPTSVNLRDPWYKDHNRSLLAATQRRAQAARLHRLGH